VPFHWYNPSVAEKAGSVGGRSTSVRKAAAARRNGSAPCAPGKRRGRPRKEEKPGLLLLAIDKINKESPNNAAARAALLKETKQARALRAIEAKWAKREVAEKRKATRVPWNDLRRGFITYLQSTERTDREQERWYDKYDTHPLPRIHHVRVYFRRLPGYYNLKTRALHTGEVPSIEHIIRYMSNSDCTDRAARAIHFDIKLALQGKPIKPPQRRRSV